jgi:hypothetical protein
MELSKGFSWFPIVFIWRAGNVAAHLCAHTLLRKGEGTFGLNMHLILSVIAFPLIVTLLLWNEKLLNWNFFVYIWSFFHTHAISICFAGFIAYEPDVVDD